ncbi:MAG: hypothetical protein ACYC99_02475 [Candidatus Geothermincolia bacterium]
MEKDLSFAVAGGPLRDSRTASFRLTHVLLILGGGLLLVCVVDMISAASRFPETGAMAGAGGVIRAAGYYFGILLYTNSARILTGFALVAVGVLAGGAPGGSGGYDKATRVTGQVMAGVGALYVLTAILLAIPFGRPPYGLVGLLPPLWAAVPILLIAGVAMFGAGFVMATRARRRRERTVRRRGGEDEPAAAGMKADLVKLDSMEREGGVEQ